MEQNAFDLMKLFGGFMLVMGLPIAIGIIAILTDRD